MPASTNEVLVQIEDDDMETRSGVLYAENAYHTGKNTFGVAIQYIQQPGEKEPQTEFIEKGRLAGVYDEISEEKALDRYKELVQTDPKELPTPSRKENGTPVDS